MTPEPLQPSFLSAPLAKPLPAKAPCCMSYEHQAEMSCFPAAFTHFSPNKEFWPSSNSLTAQESNNIILGQVENMFLLKLSFYSLTLNLTPAFSTKPFLCMSARFQAIWALLLNTVFEVLRLVPNRNPPSPGWMQLFYHHFSNVQMDPDFWS